MRLIPVVGIVLSIAACGDPLAGVDRLADVDVVESSAAALPDADETAREGFFGTPAAQGDSAVVDAAVEIASQRQPAQSGGFFKTLMRRAASADPAAAIAADVAASQAAPDPDTASLVLAAVPVNAAPTRSGPDARDVPFGTVLPFGEIARVCEARGQALGQQVDSNGRRGFALFDSVPGSAARRTFYVTGFSDDCPRQFTAANALFGAPSFYEQIRFGPAGENLPVAATDRAYDKVKSSVCRAAENSPCGSKIDTLDGTPRF
jgi:hypothetical protein